MYRFSKTASEWLARNNGNVRVLATRVESVVRIFGYTFYVVSPAFEP
jgi:hypothetical protein